MFRPESIAVVGASESPGSLAAMVYGNLVSEFPGRRYPVNSRRATVFGDRAYPDVTDLPEPVDLVIVLVPAAAVPGVVAACAQAGHRSAYLLSAGFAETGTPDGRDWQQQVTAFAASRNLPVAGPNCNGFLNARLPVAAGFLLAPEDARPAPGPVALVSQSGGFGSFILNRAVTARVNVGFFASTGNEADVSVADVLAFAVEQPEITVIGFFAETIKRPGAFLAAADRAAELAKVIISVTPESSETVARAALSHTGSVVGSADVYAAACRQHGIVPARSIEELVDFALIMQDGRRMPGRRIAVVTSSGGAGVLTAANAEDAGLHVPELSPGAQAEIGALMPPFASARNPVDTTAGMGPGRKGNYGRIVDRLLADDEVDAVLPLIWYGTGPDAEALVKTYRQAAKPVVPVPTTDPGWLLEQGLPAFADPTRAVSALAALAGVSERQAAADEARSRRQVPDCGCERTSSAGRSSGERAWRARALLAGVAGRPFVLESTAKAVLAEYGMPTAREIECASEEEAVAAAGKLGGTVVLKGLSYDWPHKSDAGGVIVGLRTADEVRAAYRAVIAAATGVVLESVLVQEMAAGRLELAVGVHRDPVFGAVVAAGLGGPLVEITAEPVLLHVPFSVRQAREAVGIIAGGRITHPVRGLSGADLDGLALLVAGLGELARELPEVTSVDVNPVMVGDHGLAAVDALLVVEAGGTS
jgi:acetate---CoA ligase (ADP-forming)